MLYCLVCSPGPSGERLVVLEDLLDGSSNLVMFPTDDTGVQHTGLGVQGVDSGVDTQLSDGMR